MKNEPVLAYFRKILDAKNVDSYIIQANELCESFAYDKGLRQEILHCKLDSVELLSVLNHMNFSTVYYITDIFNCLYISILIEAPDTILLVGPIFKSINIKHKIAELQTILLNYELPTELLVSFFQKLPKLSSLDMINILIMELAKEICPDELQVKYIDTSLKIKSDDKITPFIADIRNENSDLAELYDLENKLLEAVKMGDEQLALKLLHDFAKFTVPYKLQNDHLEGSKYRLVGLNASLRKEAELVAVNLWYLDDFYGQIIKRINNMCSLSETLDICISMIHGYCKLVNSFSFQKYSTVIRKILLYCDVHLSSDLSLHFLAEKFNVNHSYLSTQFKKEVGVSLTDYVTNIRMNCASNLLRSHNFTVTEIANYVGISDVSYFSKLFKKYTSKTPSQYKKDYS